jgi:hypothetical protein
MRLAAITLTLAALLTTGCDPESTGSENRLKVGLIRNACGPTDGPALDITLSDSAVECSGFRATNHTYDGMIENYSMGNLKPGLEYRNTPMLACDEVECSNGSDTLDIQFTDTAGASMHGTYRIRSGNETRESGNFELKKCRERLFCF